MTFTGLTVGLITFASVVTGQGSSSAQSTSPTSFPVGDATTSVARYVDYTRREEVEGYVRNYFSDTPILAEIAFCESTYRQHDIDGDVLRGNLNSKDVGVMQINEFYHSDKARELGLDIHTLEGNLAFARYLYEKEGVRPWKSSSKCWQQTLNQNYRRDQS